MKKLNLVAILALVLLSVNGFAATRAMDLSWMTGHWVGTSEGMPMEAHYGNAEGGMILGMTKIASGDETAFFEFEQIVEVNGSLVLRPLPFALHGVEFGLKEMMARRVVFENPSHEFPARIIYELRANGELLARIEGTRSGQPAGQDFVFTRAN